MKLSVIFTFKDRSSDRVMRSVKSLTNQIDSNCEIIFVDYGSKKMIASEVSTHLSAIKSLRYFYVHSEGMIWNKSHALNRGIREAKGEFILIADIDLIFPPFFIKNVLNILDDNVLFNFKCFYLKEKFNNYPKILRQPNSIKKSLKQSGDKAYGLMIAAKKHFYAINGYDEYFKVWGLEDVDIYNRFMRLGLQHKWLDTDHVFAFHQWHENAGFRNSSNIARGWNRQLQKYMKDNETNLVRNIGGWGLLIGLGQRMKFNEEVEKKNTQKYDLSDYTILAAAFTIMQVFNELKKNDSCLFFFQNKFLRQEKDSFLMRTIQQINRVSDKFNWPFMLQSDSYYYGNKETLHAARDLFHFFILQNQYNLEDYYFCQENEAVKLFVKKK